jgi:hypothetical protein
VVGNTVILDEQVPEGTRVEIFIHEGPGTFELSESEWAEIHASMGEADAGQLIPADVVLERVRRSLK